MSEKNILLRMTMEKNRLIHELISNFLGHTPDTEEKKYFSILNRLGESIVYYKGELVGTVRYQTDEGAIL